MPSEFVIPTRLPASAQTWAMSRVVVLFPFVPVMATIGMRGCGRWASGPGATARRPASSASVGRAPERDLRRRRGDGLADRPAAPDEGDGRPAPIDRVPRGDARVRQPQGALQALDRQSGARRHLRRGPGGIGRELELDGGSAEEAVRAVEHAQLEKLHARVARACGPRHGAEYIDADDRLSRAAAHRGGPPPRLPRRA